MMIFIGSGKKWKRVAAHPSEHLSLKTVSSVHFSDVVQSLHWCSVFWNLLLIHGVLPKGATIVHLLWALPLTWALN